MATVGKKRSFEGNEDKSDVMFAKQNKGNYWEDVEDDEAVVRATMAAVGTKRSYDEWDEEDKCDGTFQKRYKCNYWEDPARARDLQRWGSRLAKMAAQDNYHERFLQEIRAWNQARATSASHQ